MKVTRKDKKKNKKEFMFLHDKVKRLEYLFRMYGFKVTNSSDLRYNSICGIYFENVEETVELFKKLQKELSKKQAQLVYKLKITYMRYGKDEKEICKELKYTFISDDYYSAKSYIERDIRHMEKVLGIVEW